VDDLDALLAQQAQQPAPQSDALDAMLSARANPPAPTPAPASNAPIRFMAPPTAMDRVLASLPSLPSWLGDRGGVLGRLAMGAADPGVGLFQLAANAVGYGNKPLPFADTSVNQRVADVEKQYQDSRTANGSAGFDPMRLAGNYGISLMVPGVASAPSGGLLAQAGKNAALGAAYNIAQPVTDGGANFFTDKAKQGAIGAAVGGIATPLMSGLASIVRPNTSPNAQALMKEGITLTPGQILGGGVQRAEDAATSIPVLGDFIRDAKNRTLLDLQRATYARALEPIGKADLAQTLPAGPEGVLGVKNALSDAYESLLPKLRFDVQTIAPQLAQLRQMASSGLPQQEADQFGKILDKNLGQLSNGVADGQTFKTITSNLATEAKNFQGSTDGYQRQLGNALAQAQLVFQSGLKASNPQFANDLARIDTGWANYARIRMAAQSAGDKSHGYTPAQLSAAVRGSDQSVGNGATATGRALMQDLSDPARAVLPSTVSDSGTPLRHAVQALVGGLVGHQMLPEALSALMVPAAGTVGGLALPYTQVGQKVMQKILAERPEYAGAIADLLRRRGGLLGASTAPALTQSLLGASPALQQ
jgi:hypothetical protein